MDDADALDPSHQYDHGQSWARAAMPQVFSIEHRQPRVGLFPPTTPSLGGDMRRKKSLAGRVFHAVSRRVAACAYTGMGKRRRRRRRRRRQSAARVLNLMAKPQTGGTTYIASKKGNNTSS